jgi:hypothetical protein
MDALNPADSGAPSALDRKQIVLQHSDVVVAHREVLEGDTRAGWFVKDMVGRGRQALASSRSCRSLCGVACRPRRQGAT